MAVKRTPSWTDAQQKAAIDSVHSGLSIHTATATYGIPRCPLDDYLTGKSTEIWRTSTSTTTQN